MSPFLEKKCDNTLVARPLKIAESKGWPAIPNPFGANFSNTPFDCNSPRAETRRSPRQNNSSNLHLFSGMPFKNSWEKKGFYTKFWGEVPEWEIESKNLTFSNDPRCDKCHYQIFDGTEVDAFLLSEREIINMASNDIGMGSYLKKLSVVLVGTNPALQKAFQQYKSTCLLTSLQWKFHICETIDQAREWLNQQELHRLRQRSKIESNQESKEQETHTESGYKKPTRDLPAFFNKFAIS